MSTGPSLNKDIKTSWEGARSTCSNCLKKKEMGDVNSGVLAQGHGVVINIITIINLLFHHHL